ncbi:alpha/beta hydrolase [Mycobacterium sp. MYCO198283]|uniref:alpha/beta hydrolase n=1 Tax=Mycobacterium sp. MYCO198283 TaxID=2883505 RepID=UPI001E3631EA|nr:alpha/beta hydrolase [Mycobacterium sp. MYCO198283]MCG5430746.1 alpha/beta hydrolase [Mycobacterium sp. MYCO198283]
MHFTSEPRHDGTLVERHFTVREVPGILWAPESTTATAAPLILLGQQGGLEQMYPRLLPRAEAAARDGFATATVELPGSGARRRIAELDHARAELREVVMAGGTPDADLIERLVLPFVDQAVPEWQATLDALLALPALREPVGVSGGFISIAVRMARVDRRIKAANLFAGSFIPAAIVREAREVTIPVHVLLQWDDAGNHRQLALDLFDALGSAEKTLAANMGGHTGVPPWAQEGVGRFFARHLN